MEWYNLVRVSTLIVVLITLFNVVQHRRAMRRDIASIRDIVISAVKEIHAIHDGCQYQKKRDVE